MLKHDLIGKGFMKLADFLNCLLLTVLLAGCSSSYYPTPIQTDNTVNTSEALATDSSFATEIPIDTSTSVPPTSTAPQCYGSEQNLPESIAGEFILSGNFDLNVPGIVTNQTPAYILIPDAGVRLTLPQDNGDKLEDFSVSPSKKWLAYYAQQSGKQGNVFIVGSDGDLLLKHPADSWWGILRWLDDNRLLISEFAPKNPFPSIVFNPFTNVTEQELQPNYPDIFVGPSQQVSTWGRYGLSEAVYTSDMSMVVYPKTPSKIVLWDIHAKKEVAEITDRSGSNNAPLWLLNEKEFIIDLTTSNSNEQWYQDELFRVGIDGQIKQLTHLVDLGYKNISIQQYSESSDGRYIAFWFAQIQSGPSRFAIYDKTSGNTKVFCTIVGGLTVPVWSPTGHQVLVDGTFDTLDNYGAIFIDVDKDWLAQVEKGVVPVGWMLEK